MSKKKQNKFKEVKIIFDQQNLEKSEVDELDIEIYCKYTNQQWKVNFVGFIVQRELTVVSFPKNYFKEKESQDISDEDLLDHIEILIQYFQIEMKRLDSLYGGVNPINSFPVNSYLNICNYYVSFGLYSNSINNVTKGYGGTIDWNKTMKNSNRYISKGNLIFDPFVLNERLNENNFITECMKYVLAHGYTNFGSLFDVGVPFTEYSVLIEHLTAEAVIQLLRESLRKTFKDGEKFLVLSLIEYFEWSATNEQKTIFITNNFKNAWENLVGNVLDNNLEDMLSLNSIESVTNELRLTDIRFEEQVSQEVIRSYSDADLGTYRVFYDHLGFNEDTVIVMDSKYYFEKSGLDYKQFTYNYIMLDNPSYHQGKTFLNGLVMPISKESRAEVMLDWRKSDKVSFENVYIVNFYLNMQQVIKRYVENSRN